jgi:hypothetical protein
MYSMGVSFKVTVIVPALQSIPPGNMKIFFAPFKEM